MSRPRKRRKVCCLPESSLFGPLNGSTADQGLCIVSVEAYETIRLIDLEGLTQEECAERMQVARGTVQNIYKEARYKIAESIVNGSTLKIEGGDFKLYSDSDQRYGCGRCRRNQCDRRFKDKEHEHEEENE